MQELEQVVLLIAKFGVYPLFVIIVWYLHKRVNKLEKEIEKKDLEIKEADKENITLNYKLLALIKKIGDNE